MKKTVSTLFIVSMLIMSVLCFTGCGSYQIAEAKQSNSRTYACDYHTLAFNTKISTNVHDNDVEISGNLFTFVTDPLKMTDSSGNVLATADDTYNLVSQDDHAILVDDKFEIAVHGNVDLLGESYQLHDESGNTVGYAEFNTTSTSGAVYNKDNEVIATYDSSFGFNDYEVTIVDNDLCSDEAILMIVASYVSDYQADHDD